VCEGHVERHSAEEVDMNDIDQKTDACTFADRLADPNRYWDISKFFTDQTDPHRYTDWEGLADKADAVKIVDDLMNEASMMGDVPREDVRVKFIRDMLLHYVYECLDQVGPEAVPSDQMLAGMLWILETLIINRCRYFLRSDAT
jgi:hypothetical protein